MRKNVIFLTSSYNCLIWTRENGYSDISEIYLLFIKKDGYYIIPFEKNHNIRPHIHTENVLYISAKDRDAFTKIIHPYIQPELKYKLHPLSCENNSVNLEISSIEDNPNPSASEME